MSISALIPTYALFNYEQCKELWEECKDKLNDDGDFDKILRNSHFFSFFVDGKFIGCINFYEKDRNLFVNAFARRGTHKENIECLKKSLTFYDCDIYAKTTHKTAVYCILKVGFKKIDDNLYILKRR